MTIHDADCSPAPVGRSGPRRLLSLLILGALVAGSSAGDAEQVAFDRHEVMTGSAEHQTVLTGFFLGGAMADVAVVQVEEVGDRRLRFFALIDGSWVQKLETTLGPEVLFVDVAEGGERDRLVTVEPGQLSWFDPDSGTMRPLVEVAARFGGISPGLTYGGAEPPGPSDAGEIPRVDLTRDLNGDGRDDVIVPQLDGFWISMQASDGSFRDPVRFGPPEPFSDQIAFDDERTYGEVGITPLTVPWYLSRVRQMDYDRDGRADLVFWDEDHFDVHLQDRHGQFSPQAETVAIDAPFDSDGTYSLLFAFGEESKLSALFGFKGDIERTVLHSLRDLNGDGVVDMVTQSLTGRSMLSLRSGFEVHFGARTADGTVFARDPSTAIRPRKGAPMGYASQWLEDFDGDDQVDVLFGSVKTGPGAMIRAMLGTSITMACELYRLDDGVYPDRPTMKRSMKSDIGIRGGRDDGFWPASLVGDLNGDRRTDLVVGRSRSKLHVYLGTPGLDSFARRPQEVAVTVPGDERNSWLTDLNRDGKQDILMHHASTTEPHRVTLLIAR
jgi:hypothetical protein